MVFHNLIMNNVQRPIFMTANRHRERVDLEEEIRTASCIRDILFSHIIINNIEKNKEMYEWKNRVVLFWILWKMTL